MPSDFPTILDGKDSWATLSGFWEKLCLTQNFISSPAYNQVWVKKKKRHFQKCRISRNDSASHETFPRQLLEVSSTKPAKVWPRKRKMQNLIGNPPTGEAKELPKIMGLKNTRRILKTRSKNQLTSLMTEADDWRAWGKDELEINLLLSLCTFEYIKKRSIVLVVCRWLGNSYTDDKTNQMTP